MDFKVLEVLCQQYVEKKQELCDLEKQLNAGLESYGYTKIKDCKSFEILDNIQKHIEQAPDVLYMRKYLLELCYNQRNYLRAVFDNSFNHNRNGK